MTTKNSLTICLTESVVFLRTADRTNRDHVTPIDSSPSMVRGLLTLCLAKPTRISSIELELEGKTSTTWLEAVGHRRTDITEEHKFFSASTVFFTATSSRHASRRTASIGPGILHREEAIEEWEALQYPPDDSENSPPPRARRLSADNSTFQREYISHHQDPTPTPPYRASPSSGSPASSIILSPTSSNTHFELDPAQTLGDLRNTLHADLESTNPTQSHLSSTTLQPSRTTSLPPTLPRSPRFSRPVSSESSRLRGSTPSPSTSRSPLSSHSRDRLSRVSSDPAHSPLTEKAPAEQRGRKTSRLTFAGLSNAIFGAVKGERSNSPLPPHAEPLTPISEAPRGRTTNKHKTLAPSRGKFGLGEFLGLDGDETSGDGWQEFKKGTYTYPISFTISANSPPTMHCEFGSVTWQLKAHVHRPGAFTQKLSAVRDVTVISCPGEDDMDEHECMMMERQWEGQMQYVITVAGRMFYVGGIISVQLTFMPLTQMKIHRIVVFLEERTDYFAPTKSIRRTLAPHRIELLYLKSNKKEGGPILPLDSDDSRTFINSPFYALCNQDDPSEMASNLIGPGPWTLNHDLRLPTCASLRFTNKNKTSNIMVSHVLKFVFRVERANESAADSKTIQKLFDIIIQTPVQILSCLCNPEWLSLPRYSESFQDASTTPQSCPCIMRQLQTESNKETRSSNTSEMPFAQSLAQTHQAQKFEHVPSPSPSRSTPPQIPTPAPTQHHHVSLDRMGSRGATSGNSIFDVPWESVTHHHHQHHHLPTVEETDTLLQRNEQFERLVSGQESEFGEAPPAYGSFSGSG